MNETLDLHNKFWCELIMLMPMAPPPFMGQEVVKVDAKRHYEGILALC
jgi:hypothetical protein